MDEEKIEKEEKGIGDYLFSWKRKFDNFWYHYKVAFIMSVFVIVFIIFCITQCASKVKNDVSIAYIGPKEINAEQYNAIQAELDALLGEDLNGDGKIHAGFTQFLYMTSLQIENAKAQGQAVDMQSIMTVQTQIELEFATGNIIVYFIDRNVYNELSKRQGLFMDLEDALGYMPENINDACSIELGSLPCWDYYEGLHDFPASTIVAVRDILLSESDNEKIKEQYEKNLLFFKRLVEFTFGEE